MLHFTKDQAREIMLRAQGLTAKNNFGNGLVGTLGTLQHLGYVQIDTLAVVARAHHHTLWTRNRTYTPMHLDMLVREGKAFEYWSHAASYLPMEDFRFSLPRKAKHLAGHAHWFSRNKKLMSYVLDRIRAEGPLQSKDFETDRKRGSWFDWKPAKIALEQLFMEGSLMVRARQGFQKVYDLTERVVPSHVNQTPPTADEYAEYLIRFNLRALGLATLKDFTHLRSDSQPAVLKALKRLVNNGSVLEVKIDDIKEPWYVEASTALQVKELHRGVTILSPFDNLVIRRERLNKLFGYDYTLECYLPEPKRKFGYFCLPILYKGNFAAQLDPKADRASGIFHVKNFHLQQRTAEKSFFEKLNGAIQEFAAFNGCDTVKIDTTVPLKMRKLLRGS